MFHFIVEDEPQSLARRSVEDATDGDGGTGGVDVDVGVRVDDTDVARGGESPVADGNHRASSSRTTRGGIERRDDVDDDVVATRGGSKNARVVDDENDDDDKGFGRRVDHGDAVREVVE